MAARNDYDKWTPAEKWALVRAYREYAGSWKAVREGEPIFQRRTYDALRLKGKKLIDESWQPPSGTPRVKLNIETREPPPPRDEPLTRDTVTVETNTDERDYFVADGKVIFAIGGKTVSVDCERWEQICEDYSSYGGNMTQAQLARKHGLPLPLVRRMLSAYDQYHASPPLMRETIAEADDLEPLFERISEVKERRFLTELEDRQYRKVLREWREMRTLLDDERRHDEAAQRIAASFALPTVEYEGPDTGDHWTAIAPTTDEHLGLPVWSKAAFGSDQNTGTQRNRLIGHGHAVADWVRRERGVCDHLIRPLCGDFFHAILGRTEHGTPLDQDTRYEKVWQAGVDGVLGNVEPLLKVATRVTVLGVPGNHDGDDTYKFMLTLKYAFQHEPRIEVIPSPRRFEHIRVGTTLHVFDHGYGVGSLGGWKAKAQAHVVAREIAGEEYQGVKRVIVYVGHKHTHEEGALGSHLELIRLLPLCETDDYATSLRYHGRPGARVFRLDKHGDRFREEWIRPEMMRATTSPAPSTKEPAAWVS